MAGSNGIELGFDPGGKGSFGWSVCSYISGNPGSLERIKTGLADDAWDALSRVKDAIRCSAFQDGYPVLAAGIDAPLFWSREGNRKKVEQILREVLSCAGFENPGSTVQAVNSLRGACSVQGVLLARYLHCTWKSLVTESHPKALQHLVRHTGQPDLEKLVERLTRGLASQEREHERDATLAAVSAWAAIDKGNLPGCWTNLYEEEPKPIQQPFGTPVSYWMPIP